MYTSNLALMINSTKMTNELSICCYKHTRIPITLLYFEEQTIVFTSFDIFLGVLLTQYIKNDGEIRIYHISEQSYLLSTKKKLIKKG